MCQVYTAYHATSNIEYGSSTSTVDNPPAKARGLSLRTGGQLCSIFHMYLYTLNSIKKILLTF